MYNASTASRFLIAGLALSRQMSGTKDNTMFGLSFFPAV